MGKQSQLRYIQTPQVGVAVQVRGDASRVGQAAEGSGELSAAERQIAEVMNWVPLVAVQGCSQGDQVMSHTGVGSQDGREVQEREKFAG